MATAERRQTRAAAARQNTAGNAADVEADVEARFLKSFFADLCGGRRRAEAGVAATARQAAPARQRPE